MVCIADMITERLKEVAGTFLMLGKNSKSASRLAVLVCSKRMICATYDVTTHNMPHHNLISRDVFSKERLRRAFSSRAVSRRRRQLHMCEPLGKRLWLLSGNLKFKIQLHYCN